MTTLGHHQRNLNSPLLIFKALIRVSSVDGGILSLAAAPDGPETRPLVSASAASMISRSLRGSTSTLKAPDCIVRNVEGRISLDSQLSSTEKFSVSHTMIDRSITFCNSRMFPGQGYDSSIRRVFLSTVVILLPAFSRVAINEVFNQERNILFSASKRRNFDRKDIQAVKQITAERPSADSGLQVTVRGCDHSNVGVDSTSAADTLKLVLLQNTQEGNLSLGWKISDFIQEDRAANC